LNQFERSIACAVARADVDMQGIFGGGLSDPASPTRTELGVRHECLPLRAVRLFDSNESETDCEDWGERALAPVSCVSRNSIQSEAIQRLARQREPMLKMRVNYDGGRIGLALRSLLAHQNWVKAATSRCLAFSQFGLERVQLRT
jgi:hypothetical protein